MAGGTDLNGPHGLRFEAARRAVIGRHPQADLTSFHSVRLRGAFLGWTFHVGSYPEGRFGFITVDGIAGPPKHELRLQARQALYRHTAQAG